MFARQLIFWVCCAASVAFIVFPRSSATVLLSVSSLFEPEPLVSILDRDCERLWLDSARNDPALECYLTSKTDRLCQPAEKEHLLWFITRYEEARAVYEAKLYRFLTGVQSGSLTISSESAEHKLARLTKAEASKLSGDESFVKATKLRSLGDPHLSKLLRALAEKGYVSADDFGWLAPYWVEDAFPKDLVVKPVCIIPPV